MIEIRCDKKWCSLVRHHKLEKILKIFLKNLYKNEHGLSVYITDDAKIKKLNMKFFGEDSPTDILSWSYTENETDFALPTIDDSGEKEIAGDLMISAERVIEQAIQNGGSFEKELIRLLAHGCVHLAGWDHERSLDEAGKMLELEIYLLKKVGLSNIY